MRAELLGEHSLARQLSRVVASAHGARAAVRVAGTSAFARRAFARWMFGDTPRTIVRAPVVLADHRPHGGRFSGARAPAWAVRWAASMTSNWNFAEIWELCAELAPESPALVLAGGADGSPTDGATAAGPAIRRSWREFDRRAAGVARTLLDAGLTHQDKVAQYLYNARNTSSRCSPASRPAWRSSTPTSATRTTSSSTSGTTPMWSRSCSTAPSPSRRPAPRPVPAHPHLAVGRRRQRAVPALGRTLRGRRGAVAGPGGGHARGPWGVRVTISCCSTPAVRPGCRRA